MSSFTVTLPGGAIWTPRFAEAINEQKCIGCGRCFKVCGRDVLQLVGLNHDGERIAVSSGADDEDEDEDEYERKIMTISNPSNCVGCEACMRICPKKCFTLNPSTV